jgi:type IV pilus assembly protein PilW
MVELLVSMTLGLLLTIVIGQVFLASKESYRTTEDLSRLQENARFAVSAMTRVVRMAAFTTDPNAVKSAVFPLATAPALTGANGASSAPDEITVRYQGSGDPADDTILDCHGNAIKGGDLAVARYYLAAGADGANALFCDNTGTVGVGITTGPVELASGVENVQILYGEDTDADGTANRYVTRADVGNLDNVVSLRFALLVRSTNEVAASTDTRTYNLLGTVFDPVDDRRLRRVFTATIALRNRVP